MAVKKAAKLRAHLSLRQASAHLQITERKLSYWASIGVIEGKRNGKEYNFGRRALLTARLVDAITVHVSMQALRPHLNILSAYVGEMMWFKGETWIIVMLSDVAVKRIERRCSRDRSIDLAMEGPMFAIRVPLAWMKDNICSEQ